MRMAGRAMPGRPSCWCLEGVRGAAGSGELLGGGLGEGVGGDVELGGDVAVAQNLDQGVLANGALGHQVVDGDLAALGEQAGDVADVDRLVLGAEAVAEAAQLRQPHVDGHLAALEPGRDVLARLGALGAAAGSLALGALTPADPGLLGLRARGGTQVMDLDNHQSTSSTVTRWRTVWISPRTSGVSSRTVDWRILRRPRVRRDSRWFRLVPMVLRTWVTLSLAITPP